MESPTVKEQVLKIEVQEIKYQLRDLRERYDALLLKCRSYEGFLRVFNRFNTDEFGALIDSGEENKDQDFEAKLLESFEQREAEFDKLNDENMGLKSENIKLNDLVAQQKKQINEELQSKEELKLEFQKNMDLTNEKFKLEVDSLKKQNVNINNAIYWIEWILGFESLSKKEKKVTYQCQNRNMPVSSNNQKDIIWMIWDVRFLTVIYPFHLQCNLLR